MAIDTAILNGKALSAIARDFGFSYTSGKTGREVADHKPIQRHRDVCMPDAYQAAMAEAKVENGVALASEIRALQESVAKVIRRAETGHPVTDTEGVPLLDAEGRPIQRYDDRLLLAAVREARGNVELAAKLAGNMPDADQGALDRLRKSLENPEVRRLLAKIDQVTAED